MQTYRVVLRNPADNPQELEERVIYADTDQDAQAQALEIMDTHPFLGVSLVSVDLLEPLDFYHET